MRRAATLVAAALAVAGCGANAQVPPAPVARGVPDGYRATGVWHGDLTGARVPDVVVASSGPPLTTLALHSGDLRVLSWDGVARRWYVSFDAQKTQTPPPGGVDDNGPPVIYPATAGPRVSLLDRKADVRLGDVAFARLLPGPRQQLVFNASMTYGGSGVPTVLAVVDFPDGFAQPAFVWTGEDGGGFTVAGHRLRSHGAYWTSTDAHCCPVRTYRFAVAWHDGELAEVADDRPWLGAVVRAPDATRGLFGLATVQLVMPHSPASGRLRAGDVLLRVRNAHPPAFANVNGHVSILDQLSSLNAGDTAEIVVRRGGKTMDIRVRLASMKDATRYELADSELASVSAL